MKNYRAAKPVYGLKEGTEILNEAGGGDMIEGEALRISPSDLVGCEIFEKE